MRQQEGQWIRYWFNTAAQLGGQELSWSAIRADCWGSLVFANVFKEFDHAESGQKSWLLKMAACPFHLRGRRNFLLLSGCVLTVQKKSCFIQKSAFFPPGFYIKQITPAYRPCFYTCTARIAMFAEFCWSGEMLVALKKKQWTAQIW